MEKLVRYRWLALVALVVVLAVLFPGLQRALDVNNSLSIWFLDDDSKVQAYHEFQETFGNDEVVLIRAREPGGVFRPEALSRIEEATGALEAIDGVERTYSLLDAQRVETIDSLLGAAQAAAEGGASVEPLVPQPIPDGPDELDQIRKRALDHPLVRERFVGPDAEQTMLVVQMESLENFDTERGRIVGEVREVADDVYGDRFEMGGTGVIYTAMNELTRRDFGTFVGLGYLLMFVLLWWVFREWRLVGAALGVVFGATLFALGAMGTAGTRLNMVTVILPTLIIVLGVADVIHFPVAYREARKRAAEGTSRLEMVAAALSDVAGPCLMTSLTTMASFLALTSSRLAGVGQVGIYAAVGIAAAFVLSVVVMGIVFMSGDSDREDVRYESPRIDALLEGSRELLRYRPGAIAAVSVAVVGALAWSATQLEVDTYTLGYFPDNHRVVREHDAIEEGWGPYIPLEFTVAPAGDRNYESPEYLEKTAEFAERVESHDRIGDAIHLEEFYQYVLAQTSPGHEFGDSLNDEKVELVRDVLESRSDENDSTARTPLRRSVAEDGSIGRITLTAEMMSAATLRQTLDDLDAVAEDVFGDSAEVRASGWLPLYASILEYIVDSQVRSFGIAVGLVFLLMLIWMRSFRLALIGMVPNFLPVLVMLGTMAAVGINLNVTTASIGAIIIGVAIDDTIHFLHAWREAESEGADWSEALEAAYRRAGPAICTTTLVLAGGFPVLMLASIDTVVYFGFLTSVAAVAALFADLFVLPLLLRLWPARSD